MNRREYPAKPRKLRISVTEVGDFQSKTSCTLLGSTATPFADRMCPRNETSFSQNWHLLNLAYNWCSRSLSNTIRRCLACSSSFLEYTRMSSMKTTTHTSSSVMNTGFMRYMKKAGALVNPKDITKNS